MTNNLLNVERSIYNSLKNQGRDDTLARLVLEKIENKIKIMEQIDDKKNTYGTEGDTLLGSSRPTHYAKETMRGYWAKLNGYIRAILKFFKGEALQNKEATK